MPDQHEPVAGDLVQTPAGEYAIVVNATMRELFLASGVRELLARDDFQRLRCLPILAEGKSCGRANFA
ncbi:MAG: hypothetical protein IIB46_03995, partial [Nitrospinae bacterium]|nr:hypothetical protein [Nitrospinota bacterium]